MKFISFNVEKEHTCFVSFRDAENTNEVTSIKFTNINGESPIQLLSFNEKRVIFKVLKDCHTIEWDYQNVMLKAGDIVYGYPDTKIEVIKQ